MTTTQHQGVSSAVPAQAAESVRPQRASAEQRRFIHGRQRSEQSQEEYLRSEQEQAAIDIAAGW